MADNKVDLGGYIEVSERIVDFRNEYPGGCLRPADPARPYSVETIGDKTYIVVVAAAYRTAEDVLPGIGMAWELFPGKTSFTKDSELQNAETSAWGRAIVAALAADTKRGIATADEVRARTARAAAQLPDEHFARAELTRLLNQGKEDLNAAVAKFAADNDGDELKTTTNVAAVEKLIAYYRDGGE